MNSVMGKKQKEKLRVAVIGVGNMGRHHVRNYANINNVNLVGICDHSEKLGVKLSKEFKTSYYKDYRELLDLEKPQLVSIAVPTKIHYPIAMEVIKRKIHLLVEKPIAFNVNEAEEMINEIKSKEGKDLAKFFQKSVYYRTARLEWMNKACFIVRPLLEDASNRLKIKS